MDAQAAISAIGSVGFPIVACIGLFNLYDKTIKEIVNALSEVKSTLNGVNQTLIRIDSTLEELSK
jgi:hypothetical protein